VIFEFDLGVHAASRLKDIPCDSVPESRPFLPGILTR